MAKSDKNKNTKNDIDDIKSKGVKIIDKKLDGKQREVVLSTDKKTFTVTKENLNAPYSENFKTEKEARAKFEEMVNCTNN